MAQTKNTWIKPVGAVLAIVAFAVIAVELKDQKSAPAAKAKKSAKTHKPFVFHNDAENPQGRFSGQVDPQRLEESIHLAAGYLVNNCDANGKFVYRVNMDPDIKLKPKYNMLRHAGTIYSLASYYLWHPDEKVKNAIMASMGFLKKRGFDPVPGREDMLAVWSRAEITGREAPLQAKLGGAGLALVAALTVEKMAPGTTPAEDLKRLGNFILYMQKEDGSFYSKYIPARGGKDDEFVSRYYPGEAAFGLVMLYEYDGSAKWLNSALRVLGYLAGIRKGQTKVEPDHWALLATARLYDHYDATDKSVSKDAVVQHALQIASYMVGSRPSLPQTSPLFGTLGGGGAVTPTATRLEGLLAFMDMAEKVSNLAPRGLEEAVREGIAFVMRSQVRSGEFKGGIPRAIRREPKGSESYNTRAPEIRIDYNQHAMSAMIQVAQRMKKARSTESSASDSDR